MPSGLHLDDNVRVIIHRGLGKNYGQYQHRVQGLCEVEMFKLVLEFTVIGEGGVIESRLVSSYIMERVLNFVLGSVSKDSLSA